jgi:uncharacterized membrane protein SirB2
MFFLVVLGIVLGIYAIRAECMYQHKNRFAHYFWLLVYLFSTMALIRALFWFL